MAPAQLAEELTQLSAPVTFSGDGVDPYRTLFAEALGANFQLPADGNTLFFAAAAAVWPVLNMLPVKSAT